MDALQTARERAGSAWSATRGLARRGGAGARDAVGGAGDALAEARDRARDDHRVAIAGVVVLLALIAWIAWTVYVWGENGANAGVGVLVSWPATIAALALTAAAGYGIWLLIRRLVPSGGPALGPAPEAEAAADEAGEGEGSADDERKEDAGDQREEGAGDDEQEEAADDDAVDAAEEEQEEAEAEEDAEGASEGDAEGEDAA